MVSENAKGSDIVLEAILEAEVAHNAKDFFSRPENQIKGEETGDFFVLVILFTFCPLKNIF